MSEIRTIIMVSAVVTVASVGLGCARAVDGSGVGFAESGDFGGGDSDGGIQVDSVDPPVAPSVPADARLQHLGAGAGVAAPTVRRAFFGARPLGGAGRLEGKHVWLKPWIGTAGATKMTLAGAVGPMDAMEPGAAASGDGTRSLTLRIYNSAGVEASALLMSAQLNVELVDGVFQAALPEGLHDAIASAGGHWIRWSFEGDALEPPLEVGLLPFAGRVSSAIAQEVYPRGSRIPTQAFATAPVVVTRGVYVAGDLVDPGLPAGWTCHHEARVIGGTRLLTSAMVETAHCGQDATFGLQQSAVTAMVDAHVGGGHPEITCLSGDAECHRRVSVIVRYRGTEFSCAGVSFGELPTAHFASTAPVVLDPLEPESELYAVNVVSTCHPA